MKKNESARRRVLSRRCRCYLLYGKVACRMCCAAAISRVRSRTNLIRYIIRRRRDASCIRGANVLFIERRHKRINYAEWRK